MAQEQATGLHQVNTAVNQMDQVTQQNAAMVEHTIVGSHSLGQETAELATLIGRFQLGAAEGQRRHARTRLRPVAPSARPVMKLVPDRRSPSPAAPVRPRQPETVGEANAWKEF